MPEALFPIPFVEVEVDITGEEFPAVLEVFIPFIPEAEPVEEEIGVGIALGPLDELPPPVDA
jgi:hypothetical protein